MKKTIVILFGLGFLFLSCDLAYTQSLESEIENVFLKRQKSVEKKDYKGFLKYQPEYYKKEDINEEKVKEELNKPEIIEQIFRTKIKEIILISPNRAFVKTIPPLPFDDGYYLVKQGDQWTFDALSFRYIRVLNELNDIMNLIFKFYKTAGRLPENMEEIIRVDNKIKDYHDLFDDIKSPYRYILYDDNSCKVYSVGPDNKDNKGGELYKPQKGVLSTGDIFLTGEIF